MRAAGAVRDVATRRGLSPAQVALAWLLHKGDDIVPIPGTKRRKYLEENVKAAEVRLTPDELSALDAALAPGRVSGPRYAPANQAMVDR
jgi:aryl-alcohol dehydrogenase-like predicted oxidoreductase